MDNKNELDINTLSSVSGGVTDGFVNVKPLTQGQAKDYQDHGSTVVYIEKPGEYKLNNGQRLDLDKEGFYLLYH